MKRGIIEFIPCKNGHFYNSNEKECPYCKGRKIEVDLKKLEPNECNFPDDQAMCYDIGPL